MSDRVSAIAVSPGVLAADQIATLFDKGIVSPIKGARPDIDSSAFDLRVGETAWRLDEGQRPTTREFARLKVLSSSLKPDEDENGKYFQFEARRIYLVELDCFLKLPGNISGRATGKSSIGRLDVITRLITDRGREYDIVEDGYDGQLYLLVLSQTFPIRVGIGQALNQLRLFSGPPSTSVITRELISHYGTPFWYVPAPDGGSGRRFEQASIERTLTADPTLCDLTVDLSDPRFNYIYRAECNTEEPIDLRRGAGSHDPMRYFSKSPIDTSEPVCSTVLEQGNFYIMKSRERLHIPEDVAVEVVAISERIGDIRIHYAGFAHPGFGRHDDPAMPGTPLIFEVRATDMATKLYDGSLLARMQLFRMSRKAEAAKSDYDRQELKLSKVFSDWSEAEQ